LVETILDWRPFEYFTFEGTEGNNKMRQTYRLESISDGMGTRLQIHNLMISPALPRFIRRPLVKMMFSKLASSLCQEIAKHIARETDAEPGARAVQAAA
jgi:hypothetical protein